MSADDFKPGPVEQAILSEIEEAERPPSHTFQKVGGAGDGMASWMTNSILKTISPGIPADLLGMNPDAKSGDAIRRRSE